MTRLRTIFLGTPEFAVLSLLALLQEVDILAVITQPDRPKGRGRQVAAPPIAEVAKAKGFRLLQPARLKTPDVLEMLRDLAPDLAITVAYGKIIPREVLELPPLGSINLHPSLLPKYRGASPIQAAIRNGDRETGLTIMYQSMELDAGDLILQRRVPVAPDDTARTLEEKLARIGAEVLVEAVRLIADGRAPRIAQDPTLATYAGKLEKEHGRIDWTRSANDLVNLIRAMDPWPSAYTTHRGQLLKVWKAAPAAGAGTPGAIPAVGSEQRTRIAEGAGKAGTVLDVRPGEGILVAAGQGVLRLLEVQPEGRRRMSAEEYARGARLEPGERLG